MTTPISNCKLLCCVMLLTITTPSHAKKKISSVETCKLFMAPSTIPNAGIGVFTAVNVEEGENLGYPDLAIPVTDVDWHNGGNRQVSCGAGCLY